MSLLSEIYNRSLTENEKNLRFWEDYLQNLKSLDFDTYLEKLKVPVLVPIGSRILFRGELKHTNEVTVALGADYFVKCSLKQAEVLKQHRIKDAESKLETFRKEREFLENRFSFSQQAIFDDNGQEIIEHHTVEDDRVWREKHRENVRKWKQKREDREPKAELTDQELWERLEELELEEELQNELGKEPEKMPSFVVKHETIFERKDDQETAVVNNNTEENCEAKTKAIETKSEKKVKFTEEPFKATEKFELLQKVIDKQNELEEKLTELRNKDRSRSKTEQDLIAKLDEMEELEDLQDEMDRLEDIIETEDKGLEDSEEESSTSLPQPADLKRKVSFADEDDSETLELTFHHTDIEPTKEPYDPKRGITKPSDIYEAYSTLFTPTTSILKKTMYEDRNTDIALPKVENIRKKKVEWPEDEVRTIVVKDVVEKVDANDNKFENTEKRPTSLFKQRRQQQNK